MKTSRTSQIVGAFVVIGAGLGLVLLRATGTADLRAAVPLVRAWAPPGGRALGEVLVERDPRAAADTAFTSRRVTACRGFVLVRADLAGGPYDFGVDVAHRTVHASNEPARLAMEAAARPR
jgi:hypothetical protein